MADKATRTIQADDLYILQFISGVQAAPDGNSAVYAQHRIIREHEKKAADLWITPTAGGEPLQFTFGDAVDREPQFSPDGKTIAFLSNRKDEKQFQIYTIPVSGGEARQLTNLEGTIQSLRWAPDGKRLLLTFVRKDAEAVEREKDESKKKLGVVSRRITRTFFKLDGAGYYPNERMHVWIVDAATGEATQITSGEIHDERDAAWTPHSDAIVYVSNRASDPDLALHEDALFVRTLQDGLERRIDTPRGQKQLPTVSPDGRHIAYYGVEAEDPWGLTRLWVVPIDGPQPARCLTEAHDLQISAATINDIGSLPQMPPEWSSDGTSLVAQVTRHGQTTLKRFALDGSVVDIINGAGVVGAFSFSNDEETLVYFYATMRDPGDVWVRRAGDEAPVRLTRINADFLAQIDLGEVEEVWFKGPDGNDLQGWIMTPPGFDPTKSHPSILEIHGGPQVQYGEFFMHEFFTLAAQGYVVYFCNPRGGQGYGDAHCRAIANQWGTVDYADLMAWADLVAAKPYVDPGRMGVTGGSYGGYMTNWIISHTDRFQAAVTQRCVSNLASMWGSSDFNWAFQEMFGNRPPWENIEDFWRQSPIRYFADVHTPTLVIHSEADLRCAIEQGEQVFVALKCLGVDTEMIRYPDEPHGLSRQGRTDRRIDRLHQIARWFDTYLF